MTTYIDVIRHGEPVGGRRYRGYSIDDPLTEKGWSQMRSAVPESPKWQHIISSPLKRCLTFSEELANDLQIPFTVEDNVKEIGFGEWEGKTPEDILAQDSEALSHFYADPVHNRPSGAEPLDTFSERVWNAYLDILNTHKDKHILIVAHAGVARAITANILKMSLDDVYSRLKIEYGAIIHSAVEDNLPPKLLIQRPK
ncbi:Alpha-ribazole-5'-phosphate phosphatase [hydrothermal vent metagenome]|uniref:Alpha-ribazole-5'-phosphate phosphatase n=1 Tax=hydrothermal vent metagenome TaxID=652676 RepID=A0A3B0WK54_9ZZZZ